MNKSLLLRFIRDPLFNRLKRKGNNIKLYGYSATYDEHNVHIASLKVNIPQHMRSEISASDIEGEIEEMVKSHVLARREMRRD